MHHTVRDEETRGVSFFKNPNKECQEAEMTFGAAKAINRLGLEIRVCSVNPVVVTEVETSIHWAN